MNVNDFLAEHNIESDETEGNFRIMGYGSSVYYRWKAYKDELSFFGRSCGYERPFFTCTNLCSALVRAASPCPPDGALLVLSLGDTISLVYRIYVTEQLRDQPDEEVRIKIEEVRRHVLPTMGGES